MRRVLVTGGAGFIGVNLVEHLLVRTDVGVTVLDALTYAATPEALTRLEAAHPGRVRLVVGDVADAAVVDPLVATHDTVVHLAAHSHNDRALREPMPFVVTNLVGTAVVLEAVRRHDVRLHHVSTDEVYGDLPLDDEVSRFTEHTAYAPSSPYAASKAGADHLVRAWTRSYGLRTTITGCSNNYGPWQHVEKFVPRQVTNLLTGRRARVFGSGAQVRDWIHVDDHSAAVLRVLERGEPGGTYLVGADARCSNLDVVRALLEITGRGPDEVDLVADRPGHDRRYAVDASRLRDELGWAPVHDDLAAGLERTVDWYRRHEAWWRPAKQQVEDWYAATGQ